MNISALNCYYKLGFYILTATLVPPFKTALCTYAIEALAIGSLSNSLKISSGSYLRSCLIIYLISS